MTIKELEQALESYGGNYYGYHQWRILRVAERG